LVEGSARDQVSLLPPCVDDYVASDALVRVVEAFVSRCGSEAYFCLVEPITEYGMADYRLDEVENPERHPDAVRRLTEPLRRSISSRGGELPGRKIDGRR
jgi:hypothetical protein